MAITLYLRVARFMVRYSRVLLAIAFMLGVSAGLRSMTPLAVVAWAAGSWGRLNETPLAFMTSSITAWIFTALAAGELVADKLPLIPGRLTPGPLGGRILSGGLCGAVICGAHGQSLIAGAVVGAIGGLAGSFAGYYARRSLTVGRNNPDRPVALAEDVVAIGLAILAVFHA